VTAHVGGRLPHGRGQASPVDHRRGPVADVDAVAAGPQRVGTLDRKPYLRSQCAKVRPAMPAPEMRIRSFIDRSIP
jgi:hypothetical protein